MNFIYLLRLFVEGNFMLKGSFISTTGVSGRKGGSGEFRGSGTGLKAKGFIFMVYSSCPHPACLNWQLSHLVSPLQQHRHPQP